MVMKKRKAELTLCNIKGVIVTNQSFLFVKRILAYGFWNVVNNRWRNITFKLFDWELKFVLLLVAEMTWSRELSFNIYSNFLFSLCTRLIVNYAVRFAC